MKALTITYQGYIGSDWATFSADGEVLRTGHPEDFWYEAAYWCNRCGGWSSIIETYEERT